MLIMTTSGARSLPQASLRVRGALISRPDGSDIEAVVAHLTRVLTLIGSPAYPPDAERLRERLLASVQRAWRPAGTARQLAAIVADGNRSAMLSRIKAPTRIVHGADDPLVPVAAGARPRGEDRRRQARHRSTGMGHDLPLALLPRFADGIASARRARLGRRDAQEPFSRTGAPAASATASAGG